MRKDREGNKLYRKMSVKIIFPDSIFPDRTYTQHAGPQRGFGPDGVNQMLDSVADDLDAQFPWWEFRSVELMPVGSTVRFAFIFAGNNHNYVTPAPKTTPDEGSKTLDLESPIIQRAESATEGSATQ